MKEMKVYRRHERKVARRHLSSKYVKKTESVFCGMEDELFDLANEWMDNVTGLDSIMDVPFEIYKNNPDATMTEAKKHMFTPDQRRMMEAHERNDAVCASARDKRPSQRF